MQYNVQNPQAAMRIGVVACILFLAQASGTPETAVAGPCYSQDLSVYCTQCPSAAKCDPACSSYGYDPCECPPYPCDPPPFSCPIPEAEYGINICFDPPCTWIGNHAKYIISYGSGWDPAYPLFASFIANDQGETCFDPGCFNDALYPPDEECFIANRHVRNIQPAGPVPCGQVVLDVFATEDEAAWQGVFCEPGEWCSTAVLPVVQGCDGYWYATAANVVGPGGTSFVTAPVIKECGPGFPPQPGDPPREICPGTTICLDLLFYCHEAYLYEAGDCFDLYKKCGASPMTKIDFGDPLGSLLRSGCEFYAVAERPGYSEISLRGEDSWGRPKEGFAPLWYEVCHDCNGVCYDPATEGCCNGTKYTLATHGCCPATQPADEKVYRKDDQACCGPKAIVYNVYSKKCCQAVEPEDWKTVDLLMQDCCGPEAIPYDKNFEGCCGPSKHHNPPLWLVYDYETECCEPCDMVPKTKPPEFPPSACRAPDCAGEYFCCGSDGNTYEAIAMTSAQEFSACQTAGRLRPKWNNPGKTEYNGCGPEGMFHPDLFDNPPELIGCDVPPFGNTGSAPCDHHDLRYGNCGCNKAAGDSEFKDHMDAICHQLEDGICKDTCYAVAWAYYNAVANFGDDAYRAAQIEDCLCCQQP